MSFVVDQVRRVDAQLDRIQFVTPNTASNIRTTSEESHSLPSDRALHLQSLIKSLSPHPSSRNPLLSTYQVQYYLTQARLAEYDERTLVPQSQHDKQDEKYEEELSWLLVAKATVQVYGLILSNLLDETVALADDVWYWDQVLTSQRATALYSVQTSPLRLLEWSSNVWADVKQRSADFTLQGVGQDAQQSLTARWSEFYGLVKEVVRDRGVKEMRKRVVGPVARIRGDVRQKQNRLKKCRLRGANALGVLLGEGLMNESVHGEGLATPNGRSGHNKWKASVARNVSLMDAVLMMVNEEELPVEKFDAAIGALTDEDPLYDAETYEGEETGISAGIHPTAIAKRLLKILESKIPEYSQQSKAIVHMHGKPSRLVRYWLPVTIAVLSSSTILRILVNRKAEILTWIQEFGHTIMDFWSNWVVEPTRKVIATIRHDKDSEVSIMSKRSLEGDRASLERMVVDFAVDNPGNSTDTGNPLTDTEIADIRAKVREGDLTPVLKAYEKDLASPFMGTVRGNLIRALLIQVQKTKVDVEVAMGGIDALLKSQELVFGFVGLTPGILVTIGISRWLSSALTSRRGADTSRKMGHMMRQLRNIDRVLTNSTATEFGELFYKDHGLLLCEVHVLREAAFKIMPTQIYRDFAEDVEELVDVRTGVKRQRKVVSRIRWAYKRYF